MNAIRESSMSFARSITQCYAARFTVGIPAVIFHSSDHHKRSLNSVGYVALLHDLQTVKEY